MRSDFAKLSQALEALETVLAELNEIATRSDIGRRADLIRLRREHSQQIVDVGTAADPVFSKAADPEIERTYRAKFSRMRSATALHQANWPAVKLDQAGEAYKQSGAVVQAANQDFVTWVRNALGELSNG
jgi:hypothetical protein